MTKLNLHTPAAPANENISWDLKVETHTREQLIRLGVYLARAFSSDFFYEAEDPPLIRVNGGGAAGKCMLIEAMMKTLLDQTDPRDMLKPDAPNTMFIEKEPTQALYHYCYAAGTHDGVSVLYAFDRRNVSRSEMAMEFDKAVAKTNPAPAGGAIFSPNGADSDSWLAVRVYRDSEDSTPWSRTCALVVNSEKLKNDPKFRLYWTRLQDMVRSGDLAPLAKESAPALSHPRALSFRLLAQVLKP